MGNLPEERVRDPVHCRRPPRDTGRFTAPNGEVELKKAVTCRRDLPPPGPAQGLIQMHRFASTTLAVRLFCGACSVLCSVLGCGLFVGLPEAHAQAAQHGTLGNWGGSSFNVGRSTMYANGMMSNRVGDMTYFNNGLVGRQVGNVTVYNNGLIAVNRGNATYFSNYAVGVPIRGGMVYAGGSPYPYGPTPFGTAPRPQRP